MRRRWPNWPPSTRSTPARFRLGRKPLTDSAADVFGNGREQKAKSDAALIARLYQEIGQLKVGRDFLAERSGP